MEIAPIDFGDSGLLALKPRVFEDDRGYFFESYNEQVFNRLAGPIRFIQDNQSRSVKGVLRGLHYQLNPRAQTKLVRVLEGRIWDVAVDLRKSSKTFGKHYSIELSADNKLQFLIPQGFAHGFLTLSETAVVSYKVDDYLSKEHERGVRFDDPTLNLQWPEKQNLILSPKDLVLPTIEHAEFFQ